MNPNTEQPHPDPREVIERAKAELEWDPQFVIEHGTTTLKPAEVIAAAEHRGWMNAMAEQKVRADMAFKAECRSWLWIISLIIAWLLLDQHVLVAAAVALAAILAMVYVARLRRPLPEPKPALPEAPAR